MVQTAPSAASSDDDWIIHADWRQTSTTAAATDLTSGGDWVLAENPFASPSQRLLGVFLHLGPGRHAYAPLIHPVSGAVVSPKSRAADLMSSLPCATTICASCQGFVLARGPWSSYYVSAPSSNDWTPIRKPPIAHSISAPLAFAAHSSQDFLVICAVSSMKGIQGFYRFEIYDSSTGHWSLSGDLFPMGKIVDSLGVSCGETVFFRTAVPSIAAFDTATGLARVLAPPPRCLEKTVLWQLVEAGGRLRCVCVMEGAVEVYQLGEIADKWESVTAVNVVTTTMKSGEEQAIFCKKPPQPLRSQGEKTGILLWLDGRVVWWDIQRRMAADLGFEDAPPPLFSCANYVPFCGDAAEDGSG